MPDNDNINTRQSFDSFEMSYDSLAGQTPYQPAQEAANNRISSRRARRAAQKMEGHATPNNVATSTEENSNEEPVVNKTTKNKNTKKTKEKNTENIKSFSTIFSDSRLSIFFGIVILLFSAYSLIAGISYLMLDNPDQSIIENNTINQLSQRAHEINNTAGPVGASLSNFFFSRWLGIGSFVIIAYLVIVSLSLLRIRKCKFWSLSFKSLLSALSVSVLTGTISAQTAHYWHWGGETGYYIYHLLTTFTGVWGMLFVNIIFVAILILIFYNTLHKGFVALNSLINQYKTKRQEYINEIDEFDEEIPESHTENKTEHISESPTMHEDERHNASANIEIEDQSSINVIVDEPFIEEEVSESPVNDSESTDMEIQTVAPIEEVKKISTDSFDPTAELSRYKLPPVSLLREIEQKGVSVDQEEQELNKQRITRTLNSYGIDIASITATIGPTITLYEIIPAEGVRISKIKNLGNDMALSLSALGIRIIAPMPGKGTIGMEVPNRDKRIVSIRSILSSPAYQNSTAALPIAMGTTIQNEVYVTDLAKMPHLLVAGATGMGKSVGLNTIIASLLYKKHPAELKFVMVDPKMVEFSLYAVLERHFLAKLPGEEDAIITDPSKVVATLNSLCVEMDNRYALLRQAAVRDLKSYNEKFVQRRLNPENGHKFLPHIVVIIDEFADLILTAGKEVEAPISRIAAKARAVGIHMILATQRPSVNVITGTIKANFPGRMAFRVNQMNDSRTILDRPGADQLIGRGDMIISKDGVMERVQCALIETEEVESICKYISDQMGYDNAYELPEYIPETEGGGAMDASGPRDPLFAEAGAFIVNSGFGSTTSIQRHFNVGYPRAGKIMDQLEAAGVVGPSTGGKPRKLLMDPASFANFMQSQHNAN